MAAQDVSVLSSDDEGMPNVVMQAMVAGRPVVATDAGGTAEIIATGETGFVVPRGDATALAARIVTLLADPVLAARFGAAGRQRVERHFTFEACVGSTVALYEELLAHAQAGMRLYAA
jgi:glycosyltransferase involved in cell wall biosynthesis